MAKRDTQFINNFLSLKPSAEGHIKLHTSECIRFFSLSSKIHNFWSSVIDFHVQVSPLLKTLVFHFTMTVYVI